MGLGIDPYQFIMIKKEVQKILNKTRMIYINKIKKLGNPVYRVYIY